MEKNNRRPSRLSEEEKEKKIYKFLVQAKTDYKKITHNMKHV